MLERLLPLRTNRRTAANLVREALSSPRTVRRRVTVSNFWDWIRLSRMRGTCNVCGYEATFLFDLPDRSLLEDHRIGLLRETLRCRNCGSKMRHRALAAGVLSTVEKQYGITAPTIKQLAPLLTPDIRILDTDAGGRIGHMLRDAPGYVGSLYYPDLPSGTRLDDGCSVNVDLERMPFPDGRFDLILTTEVVEHVRHIDSAHREIARCLGPSGTYLFTAPYDESLQSTLELIDPITDEPLVWPMHMHGDGLRREGIKSYRVFGRDVIADLRTCGLTAQFTPIHDPMSGVIRGDLFTANRSQDSLPHGR